MKLIILFLFVNYLFAQNIQNYKSSNYFEQFFNKSEITILITDSGLGGLSVCAEIEKNFQEHKIFKKVNLIFVNALPDENYGYNKMKDEDEKVKVFDNALHGMVKWYRPDIILIGCNTLSVIYNKTYFSDTTKIPVIGIVNFGVDMIYEKLTANPNSSVIIFGTPTTISNNSHKEKLIERGIAPEQIIYQACEDLESEIQINPESEIVKMLIEMYVEEALAKLNNKPNKIFSALCCTHYGYSRDFFYNVIKERTNVDVEVLNPNDRMSNLFFDYENFNKHDNIDLIVKVVSKTKLLDEDIRAIEKIIRLTSSKTADALLEYELNNNLFYFNRK